ncbi:MAG: alpha/beta fold hydrolase [Deltaproteobacteria bacterium]|nr:alpha/beta fold hydrolase [Dehalococcoidia bacterium]MCB9732115.1 alpha/beta fold hydrolase [Deltaproteobacteria bacterium]
MHGPEGADAVLFGHSVLCDCEMFDAQVAALADRFRVVTVDFRGHGKSDPARSAFEVADLGRDYVAVLDAVGVQRAVVVGLSLGGMAAMCLARDAPERLRGLVLMDTNADAETPLRSARLRALAATGRLFGIRPWLRKQAMKELFGATFRARSPEIVQRWSDKLGAMDRQSASRGIGAVVRRDDMSEALRGVRVPTLVVVGDEDTATPLGYSHHIAELVPGARLEVLPQVGHLSTIEAPTLTAKLIRRFCEGL